MQKSRTAQVSLQANETISSCDGATSVLEPCNTQACPEDVVTKCSWADWMDWGDCNKCGGQRKRHRQISQMPANGAVCPVHASEELDTCPRNCHGYVPGTYCTWQSWADWGSCDATCGRGRRSRRRNLIMTANGALPDSVAMVMGMARLYEVDPVAALRRATEEMENSRTKELAMAFAGGCLAFATSVLLVQQRSRRPSPSDSIPLE